MIDIRNVTLTLDKAKEFYNSDNEALKEVALQAFTEEELRSVHYTEIKSLVNACIALGLNLSYVASNINDLRNLEDGLGDHLIAIYKLDIIHKALNGNWNPKMTKDKIYYPYIQFYPAGNKAKEAARSNGWEVKETFMADGEKFSLVGGDYDRCCYVGLGSFGGGCGGALAYLGLLGCKSREIAEHMSRYFSREIFEACYAHHVGTYKWV